ncbi:MAG: ParB/RepB/Spo0J family partition protein [Rhodobacteraceae bacterium]|nr:ParB/RepB/Spo0J family partition protein [Paracoccaceae bacterium]
MAQKDKRGLGRGLSALMADVAPEAEQSGAPRRADTTLPIEQIVPNPDQPRRSFNEEALSELSASIREKGVLQPLIVRPYGGEPPVYQIVAGERRWRAAQAAQLHDIPVIVRDFSDTEVLEIAIVENIQRADLNPIDEARGYRQLIERFGHTQEKLGEAMGKSRSHVANALRLMQLPEEVQVMLAEGALSVGHARALITTGDPLALAKQVVARSLSVRETEKLAKASEHPRSPTSAKAEKDADTKALESDLSAALGMSVTIDHKADSGGQVVIRYKSLEALDELCRVLSVSDPVGSR